MPVVQDLYGILTAWGPELKIYLNKQTTVKIQIFAGIHVNTMGILNFVRTKHLANWWTSWATYVFYQWCIYMPFYQTGIYYCTSHKYSAERIILPDSTTNLIIAISRVSVVLSVWVSKSIVKSSKPTVFFRFCHSESVYVNDSVCST